MKVAIIGTGGVANRHLGVLATLPGCTVVAHLSASLERAVAQSQRWGGQAFTDLTQMLERESPDAVWVCVTPDRHGVLEETLIAEKIPFFVEKPLSNELATAERIAELVATNLLVVGVGYKFRALDTLQRVREMLRERPARMALGAWHDKMPPPDWWRDERRSGGQLVEQATHLVDLARVLLGELRVVAASIQAQGQVTAALLLSGKSIPVTFTATSLLEGPLAIQFQLICEGRALTITERTLRIETGTEVQQFPVTVDPFLVEDEHFLRAVAENNPRGVLCDYADALATHRVAFVVRAAAV